jgi:hypothetical protein
MRIGADAGRQHDAIGGLDHVQIEHVPDSDLDGAVVVLEVTGLGHRFAASAVVHQKVFISDGHDRALDACTDRERAGGRHRFGGRLRLVVVVRLEGACELVRWLFEFGIVCSRRIRHHDGSPMGSGGAWRWKRIIP